MDFERQLLFFFSAIGAFNGLFLSAYFAFFIKNKSRSTYFLAALIFVISVRVTKSVFLTFYPGTSGAFIQIGLTACLLIGPFLYIYVNSIINPQKTATKKWLVHVLPIIVGMAIIHYLFPYRENRYLWQRNPESYLGWFLFAQWLIYILAAAFTAKQSYYAVFTKSREANTTDTWLVNVVTGTGIIWLAYNTSTYTSYIMGALSFSFTFYLSAILWFLRRRKAPLFFEESYKYVNKKINDSEADKLEKKLKNLFRDQEVYRNPNLKLSDVADELKVAPHYLSQYLNDNIGKSFPAFVNRYRVEAAEEMLKTNDQLTLEAIGNECGFKSNSSFYTSFKKFKGVTPATFKREVN